MPRRPRRARGRVGRLILTFVACVLIVDALVGEKGLISILRARRDQAALVGEVDALRQQNAVLFDEARRLREDPRTIEQIARDGLGLIKPGELLFIVKDVPPPASR